MWEHVKAGAWNVLRNAFTDKDGDFCPTTAIGIAAAVGMVVRFMHSASADFAGFAQGIALVMFAIAGKRWSENR